MASYLSTKSDDGGPGAAPAPRSQALRAYLELKQRILSNEMPAGTQALEQELAEGLGMSRTPVREALIRLANEGMVEVRPRHGMRVLPVSVDDMREIYEVLTALEATAAARVAERGLNDAELEQLAAAVADMNTALAAADLMAWARADERFHSLLVDLAGNRRLKQAVEALWDQAHRVRMLTLKLRPRPDSSTKDHAAVVAAIEAGDAQTAYRVHEDHRRRSGEMLIGILRSVGLTQL
ncbi:MAG: GntR family transcriptional regulator [Geminicoccaceae bacterium]